MSTINLWITILPFYITHLRTCRSYVFAASAKSLKEKHRVHIWNSEIVSGKECWCNSGKLLAVGYRGWDWQFVVTCCLSVSPSLPFSFSLPLSLSRTTRSYVSFVVEVEIYLVARLVTHARSRTAVRAQRSANWRIGWKENLCLVRALRAKW